MTGLATTGEKGDLASSAWMVRASERDRAWKAASSAVARNGYLMENTNGKRARFCTSRSIKFVNGSLLFLLRVCAQLVGAPCAMAVMYCTSRLPSVASHTKP